MGALFAGRYVDATALTRPTPVPPASTASYLFLDGGSLELGVVRDSLVSSGGICAPTSLFAETFENVALVRHVRDALPTFVAPRGGVELPA